MGVIQCLVGAILFVIFTCIALRKLFPWLKYDLQQLQMLLKFRVALKYVMFRGDLLCDIFEKVVKKHPKKTFLVFQGDQYSFECMDKQMNRMAHAALKLGLTSGDAAAMLMKNEPAFIWTAHGLGKIGVQPTYLNHNLRAKSLIHSVKVSSAKILIVGQEDELIAAVRRIHQDLRDMGVNVYVHGERTSEMPSGFKSLDDVLASVSDTRPDRSRRAGINCQTPACYIFTSGTTGLPKAAVITQGKLLMAACKMSSVGIGADDVIYTPLPLYHHSAGSFALGATMLIGATLVLRSKFSASQFIEDCRRHNVTIVQYIGEMCRYLCATPKSPNDKNHMIRGACGNGLRADIWQEFKDRFNIPNIFEFYGATEGNVTFLNHFNEVGAVGRCSPLMQKVLPSYIVKYDVVAESPVRGPDGFCTQTATNEVGLLIGQINKDFPFDGYKENKEQTEKKILHNVFQNGDKYFNSGDLFVIDENYFVWFRDRVGDTFRWKAENVSTVEVSNVVVQMPWIEDANIYGVHVPGQDGRAGMAAISMKQDHNITSSDLRQLYSHCKEVLPPYARPRFIRVQRSLTMTASSFKLQKVELVKEGFDPDLCQGDPLFCLDMKQEIYVELDKGRWHDIVSGNLRL